MSKYVSLRKHVKVLPATQNRNIVYIDVLSALSALAVVMLHINAPTFWHQPGGPHWFSATLIETTAQFAVPIFFMIVGVTSLNYRDRYSTGKFFQKRFVSIFIPFILWSIIYYFIDHYLLNQLQDYKFTLISFICDIFAIKFNLVFWFFIPLFYIYFAIPVLSLLPMRVLFYMFLYGLGACYAVPSLAAVLGCNINWEVFYPVCTWYLVYVLAGFLLANTELDRLGRYAIYILGFVGWFCHFYMTYRLPAPDAKIVTLYKGVYNWPTLLESLAVFTFFRYLDYSRLPKKFTAFLYKIHKCAFGVYVLHVFVISYLPGLLSLNTETLFYRTFGAFGMFALCVLLVWQGRKIRFLKILFR